MNEPVKIDNNTGHYGESSDPASNHGTVSEQNIAKYTRWLAWATIVLAFFTAGVFVYAVKQSDDAEEVITAANRQASTAEVALKNDASPWVIVKAANIAILDGNYPTITITFANIGKSITKGFFPLLASFQRRNGTKSLLINVWLRR